MKNFEVTLTNGSVLKIQAEDHHIYTSEKGAITHVQFFKKSSKPDPNLPYGDVIASVSGATFSHLEITSPPNGS